MTKEQKLRNLIREQARQMLKEWFPHKEEFKMLEDLYEQQERIYYDAADVGITPQHKDFSKIKPAIQDMVNTYGSKNFKWSGGGTVSIFVPIEMDGDNISGYELKVSFNKDSKLKTIYKKPYDAFFSIDNLERIVISKEDAVKKYNSKQFKKSEGVMREDDMLGLGMSNQQREKMKDTSEKFSVVGKEKYGMEYVVAYPNAHGIETKYGLDGWQMKDSSNRELYFAKDEKEAKEILNGIGNFGEGIMREEKDKFWMGHVGDKDDFQKPIKDEFIDGKTTYGPWGIMSPESFKQFGVGIGLGKGQWYKKQPDGQWKKIKG